MIDSNQTVKDANALITERIETAVEVAERECDNNPVGKIRRRFQNLRAYREPYFDEAKEMAELVIPGMYNGTPTDPLQSSSFMFGLDKFDTANQSLISQGVLLLSWTMANVVMPADGDYFSRKIEASVARQLEEMEQLRLQTSQMMQGAGMQGDDPNFAPISIQVNEELLRDDLIVKQQIASSNHQEVLANCFYHSLIGGVSVFGHLTLTEAKAYTIQNSICVFDSSHEAVEVIVVDRMPLVKLPESVQKKIKGRKVDGEGLGYLAPEQAFVTVYTRQFRVSQDSLRLETEIEGIPIDDLSFDIPADAPALIAVPFMFVNEVDHYPIGWLTYNRGDCFSYENLALSMEAMVAAAAITLVGIGPGARVTSEELRNGHPLRVVPTSDAKVRPEIVTAPIAQNLAQIMGASDKKERRLQLAFGMDFAIQRPGERVTAEEIQAMSAGLQKLFGATYKQTERTVQQKHCRRQFYLAEDAKLIRPVDKKSFTLTLTAGLQAQEAQQQIAKMDQILARAAQFGPQALAQFSRDHLIRWFATKMKLDISDTFMTQQQAMAQMGMDQLMAGIQQLGPNGPAMVAQILQQMTGGGGAPGEQQVQEPQLMGDAGNAQG